MLWTKLRTLFWLGSCAESPGIVVLAYQGVPIADTNTHVHTERVPPDLQLVGGAIAWVPPHRG